MINAAEARRLERQNPGLASSSATMSPGQQAMASDALSSQRTPTSTVQLAQSPLLRYLPDGQVRQGHLMPDEETVQHFNTNPDPRRDYSSQPRPEYVSLLSPPGSVRRITETVRPHVPLPSADLPSMTQPGAGRSPTKHQTGDRDIMTSYDRHRALYEQTVPPRQEVKREEPLPHATQSRAPFRALPPGLPEDKVHDGRFRESERRLSVPFGQQADRRVFTNWHPSSDRQPESAEQAKTPWAFPSTSTGARIPTEDRPPSAPLPPPAVAPKRSNVLSLLNDEPAPKPPQIDRTHTPPYSLYAMDRPFVPSGLRTGHEDAGTSSRYARPEQTTTPRMALNEDNSRRVPDRAIPTPDWASGLGNSADVSRSAVGGTDRLGPYDFHRRELQDGQSRHVISPASDRLDSGRTSQYQPPSSSFWQQHTTGSLRRQDDPRLYDDRQQQVSEPQFTAYRQQHGETTRNRDLDSGQQTPRQPEQPTHRSQASRVRGDDFMMMGSGNYRSLSAQRDTQRNYQHEQHILQQQGQSQSQSQQQQHHDARRREEPVNPFLQPEAQTRRPSGVAEGRSPSLLSQPPREPQREQPAEYRLDSREQQPPIFGRLGQDNNGKMDHQQQQK